MVSLFGWFSKPKDEDYATILSSLATDIDTRRQRLSEIRRREQRAKAAVTTYTLVGWAVYVTLWYVRALPGGRRAINGAGVLLGPVIILAMRRVIGVWYARRGDAEEKTLQKLMKEQRIKVDEIKKKTNWYETRELMQRYDEQGPSTPKQARMPGGVGSPTPVKPNASPKPKSPPSQSVSPPQPQLQLPPTPSSPARKTWLDKIADAVVGDADDTARYALICEECFSHNGLVKEQEWDAIQYVCPKCSHFNKAKRAPITPTSSTFPLASLSPSSPQHLQAPRSIQLQQRVSPSGSGSPLRHRVPSEDVSPDKMEVDE